MKDILNNKKNLLIIGGIALAVILIVVLVIVLSGGKNKEMSPETLENKLEKMGVKFYEKHYYPGVKEEGQIGKLANFVDGGINVTITNMELIVALDDDVKQQLEKDKCDFDKTRIIYYPKQPFGLKDYTMELELSCEK